MLAACGGGAAQPRRHASRPAGPCLDSVRAFLAREGGAGPVRTRVADVSPGQATCVYEADGLRVNAQVDTNPQAAFRFDRAVVERGQNAVWSANDTRAPKMLHGLGQGADWFPADRELLATDGRKLITVTLVRAPVDGAVALRLSRVVARLTLARGRA